jgi:hypothetical protein
MPVLITDCSIAASATARIQAEVWFPVTPGDPSGLPVIVWKVSDAAPYDSPITAALNARRCRGNCRMRHCASTCLKIGTKQRVDGRKQDRNREFPDPVDLLDDPSVLAGPPVELYRGGVTGDEDRQQGKIAAGTQAHMSCEPDGQQVGEQDHDDVGP